MGGTGLVGEGPLFLADFALRLLRVLVWLSLWRLVFASRSEAGGMSLAQVLTYALLSEAFGELLACKTWIESSFWSGSITTRYVRPMGVLAQFVAEASGRWAVGLLFFSVPLLCAGPLMGIQIGPVSASTGALFVLSLVLAVGVGLAIEFLTAAGAVWFELHPSVVCQARDALSVVLSGALVPLALMPWGIGRVLEWLPFASMASAPLRIYAGAPDAGRLLILQAGWIVVPWSLTVMAWTKSRERMVCFGG